MFGLLQKWRIFRWKQKDYKRREMIESAAFANGRFLMYINVSGRVSPVCFTPLESEAALFFRTYLIPWMRGELRWLSHSTWDGLTGGPVIHQTAFVEVVRGYDIHSVIVLAVSKDYIERLQNIMTEELRAAEARAEAARLADRSAAYTMNIASIRDAMRGPDPESN